MTKRLETFRVIITGATGMVGEGVLLECLENKAIEHILIVGRKPYGLTHEKVDELIVPNFMELADVEDKLGGYDACFFCAGVSSAGMSEADYTRVTYDTTMHFAETLARLNPKMIFDYVTGAHTDGTEKGKVMWARVKGKTENALMKLPFAEVYNFRPGLMTPTAGQKSVKTLYKVLLVFAPLMRVFFKELSLVQVGQAMINTVTKGAEKHVLEIPDIAALANA